MKRFVTTLLAVLIVVFAFPQYSMTYISMPDTSTNFLRNVAPGATAVWVVTDSANYYIKGSKVYTSADNMWDVINDGNYELGGSGTSLWNGIKADSVWSDSTAKVGIRTAAPQSELDVNGDVNVSSEYRMNTNIAIDDGGGILIFGNAGNYEQGQYGIDGIYMMCNSVDADYLAFNVTGAGNERMRIIANGDIGIGTSTPSAELDVIGHVEIDSNLTVRDSAFIPVIYADQLGAGAYTGNFITLYSDTIYTGLDTAATMPNGVMVADSATDMMKWIDADSVGFTDPMTTRGDILGRDAANATTRLPIGANTHVLTSDGTDFSWAASAASPFTHAGGDIYPTTATDNVIAKDSLIVGDDVANQTGVIQLIASDGDAADIGINTSGQMLFRNATMYSFGNVFRVMPVTETIRFSFTTTGTGTRAAALGDYSTASMWGQITYASGRFAVTGDAQGSFLTLRRSVTHSDAAWYELFIKGTTDRMVLPASSAWNVEFQVVGETDDAAKRWYYKVECGIYRDAANNTTLDYSTVTTQSESDADFDCRVTADDTNEALLIELTDATSGSDVVQWVATVKFTQVIF